MADKPSTILFLTGAPENKILDWSESRLLSKFISPHARFLNHNASEDGLISATPAASHAIAKWRAVSLKDQIPDDALNLHWTQFLAPHNQGTYDQDEFLDHSLAALDQLEVTHLSLPPNDTTFISGTSFDTTLTDTSIATASSSAASNSAPKPPTQLPPTVTGPITDLKRLPNAAHIQRIQPQTMTVDLLAAIITISPPRTVQTRRGLEMELIELLLGDETRAGFSITCWLSKDSRRQQQRHHQYLTVADDLHATLRQLRAGDIVLCRNVALTAFRGCVYGQTLSRRLTSNNTILTVLSEENVKGLGGVVLEKRHAVRAWADDFVGGDWERGRKEEDCEEGRRGEVLPPDTQ